MNEYASHVIIILYRFLFQVVKIRAAYIKSVLEEFYIVERKHKT